MKELFVVTHTQSVHHVENRVGGWYDTGLTELGQRQAVATAERLLSLIGHRDIELFSSDLQRAAQTADAIGKLFDRPVISAHALREISYGAAEGKPQEWLDARYSPAPEHDRLDHPVGIDGAETRRQLAQRVYPFIDAVVERDASTQIIVTHGFTLSMVIAAWMKVPIESCGFISFPASGGSITHLRQDDFFRNRAVLKLADVAHLKM